MKSVYRLLFIFLIFSIVCIRSNAADARPAAEDSQLESHMLQITSDLRCLVCQNQSIADSHSALATDLRQQVREMLQQGKSDTDIRTYMTQRYGEFVLYNPPFKASTLVLWMGPAFILFIGLLGLFVYLRQRQHAAADAFEADPQDEEHTVN